MWKQEFLIRYESINNCINSYPYLENSTNEDILCKSTIKNKLVTVFSNFLKNTSLIYEFPSYKQVILETVLIDKFLFYSIENAIEEKYYIFSKENKKYLNLEEFYRESKYDILITNDFDGIGVWIISNDRSIYSLIN